MNYSRDPSHEADMATHLERPEPHVHPSSAASRPWRDPPPPRSDYGEEPFGRPEGAAALRGRHRHPGISPWLFVMATALNTMVAAVLAVIITLGVVRQERTDGPTARGERPRWRPTPGRRVGSEANRRNRFSQLSLLRRIPLRWRWTCGRSARRIIHYALKP